MTDDDVLETMEIDLEVTDCIGILEAHGVADWTPDLVTELWDWLEAARTPGLDAGAVNQ